MEQEYERPELVEIEIDIEGSFLVCTSHPGDVSEKVSVDDEEYTDDYD